VKLINLPFPPFGKGIIYDAPDEKFQEERKFLGSCLSVQCFNHYVPIIEMEVNEYVDEFWNKDSDEVDFSAAISEIIIRTSTHCLQGPEIRAQVSQGYAQYMEDIDHALSILAFFYPYLPLPSFKKRNDARRQIGAIVKKILKTRRENPGSIPPESDLLEYMSRQSYKSTGKPVSDDEIAGFCVAMMLAGQHTSNITSSWLAILLLTDQKALNAVIEEQKAVLDGDTKLSHEHLKKMDILGASIKETLRLRPPIILIWRKAMQEFRYKEWVIPKNTLVCVSPASYPRLSDDVYTEPIKFDPHRFLEPRNEDKKKPCSYMAFSLGKHACIGEKFAYLQIKTIWSVLLRRFDLKLVGEVKDYPVDKKSMLAGPVGPVKLAYQRKK